MYDYKAQEVSLFGLAHTLSEFDKSGWEPISVSWQGDAALVVMRKRVIPDGVTTDTIRTAFDAMWSSVKIMNEENRKSAKFMLEAALNQLEK